MDHSEQKVSIEEVAKMNIAMNLFDSSQHCDATLAKAKTMTRVSAIQHQPKSKNAATMNSATLGRSKMTVSLGVPFIITVRRVVIMSIWIG